MFTWCMMCAMCVFHKSRFFLGSRAISPGARPNSGVAVTVRWPKCLSWRRAGRRLETTEDLEGSLALGFAGAVALRRGLLRALVGEDGNHATRAARERDALVVQDAVNPETRNRRHGCLYSCKFQKILKPERT